MNITHVLLIFLLVICITAQAQSNEKVSGGLQLFAPNSISEGNVYRGTFAPDGKTFYFFKKITEGEEDYRIYSSQFINETWSQPEKLSLGGDYSDLYPVISPDGKRMVFTSHRPVPGDSSRLRNANLWYADRIEEGWGEPVFIPLASTLSNYDAKPFFGPDGKLYFESTTPDWQTTQSLVTQWDGNEYTTPELFEEVEQWRNWRDDLFVWGGIWSPDGSFIVLDVSEKDAATGRAMPSDQWVSFRQANGTWTAPRPFTDALNTDDYDNFTFFSPDGQQLYFVRGFSYIYYIPINAALNSIQ